MNPCIVYLSQNTKKDLQYGRDSRSMLEKSLDLLYVNYNDQFRHPVLVFHEGDFNKKSQEEVSKGRGEIQFHATQFRLPDFLDPNEIPEKWDGLFGMGHRHMIRFYGLQIFDILKDMGFDWFFRMDDDSFLHSKITYNLFDYMQENEFDYGYRVDIKEPQRTSYGFSEAVLAYLKAERIKPHTFLNHFSLSTSVNNEYFNFKGKVKQKIGQAIDMIASEINYDRIQWPPSKEWDRWGYYNNFFITRVGFWHQQQVQSFLRYFDRLGGGYKYRWNDLIMQTVAVQIFLPPSKVHKFTDWTYEHATIRNGKLDWGGIYPGEGDEDNQAVSAFLKEFGKTKIDNSF